MRVLAYPSDDTGSGRYRMLLPVEAAKSAGCDVRLGSQGKEGEGIPIERKHIDGKTYIRPLPLDCDVLVLQRTADESTVAMIPSIQAAGIAVVIDIDDDLSCIPPMHPGHRILNPTLSPHMNWEILARACRLADLVTVTTPALAKRYGSHGRVTILENRVPESLLSMPRESDGNTVGWTGFTPTHPGDLRVTGGGVAEVVRRGARYLQVGPATGVKEQLGLDGYPESTGALPDIEDYYRAIGRLDVGICPLTDTRFAHAKSWLKPLEYMARGVAWVGSPRAEYLRLQAEDGVGLLAQDRGRSWRQCIERLLRDESLRAEQVQHGREMVAERHLIERAGHLWAEAWERALANRRKAAA